MSSFSGYLFQDLQQDVIYYVQRIMNQCVAVMEKHIQMNVICQLRLVKRRAILPQFIKENAQVRYVQFSSINLISQDSNYKGVVINRGWSNFLKIDKMVWVVFCIKGEYNFECKSSFLLLCQQKLVLKQYQHLENTTILSIKFKTFIEIISKRVQIRY